jgi:hypothetical protein
MHSPSPVAEPDTRKECKENPMQFESGKSVAGSSEMGMPAFPRNKIH